MPIRTVRSLLLDRTVVDLVSGTAQAAEFRHEVGGVLLGSYRGDSIHVTAATTPQANDRSSFARFWRSARGHQAIARRAWVQSRGAVTYVGEWHSHPEAHPTPSTIDRADWTRKLAEQSRDLAFVIRGYCGMHVEFAAHAGRRIVLREVEARDDHVLYGDPSLLDAAQLRRRRMR